MKYDISIKKMVSTDTDPVSYYLIMDSEILKWIEITIPVEITSRFSIPLSKMTENSHFIIHYLFALYNL